MGGPAPAGSAVGDRRSSGEYQVRISDNSEVRPAVGGWEFAKVSELHRRERSFPWRRAELGGAGRTQRDLGPGASGPGARTPRPEMEFVSDHKMGIDYFSHH